MKLQFGEAMSDNATDPTGRFSNRVEHYVRHRPGYPPAVVDTLVAETGLSPAAVVADVGSGTGISAEPFLKLGATVYGVEPNDLMRRAAEDLLRAYPRFHSVAGSAEATTLPDAGVDYVVAGQAFHWFDPPQARREFARILRPGGWLVLVWNTRKTDTTPFLRAYEDLSLQYSTDYRQVDHRNVSAETIRSMFVPGECRERRFFNEQVFDYEGLKGRLLSSSYAPAEGHPNHGPTLRALELVFRAHQEDGRVRFEYDTELYFGPVNAPKDGA
jgi:SAM-dependent methyltransferase